jgi:hypothetical protein
MTEPYVGKRRERPAYDGLNTAADADAWAAALRVPVAADAWLSPGYVPPMKAATEVMPAIGRAVVPAPAEQESPDIAEHETTEDIEVPPAADTVTYESEAEPRLTFPEVFDMAAATPAASDPESEPQMYKSAFWKSASERAVKTFAQTMVAALGVGSTGLVDLDWPALGALAASAALASVLTSLAGLSGPQKAAEGEPQP